MFGIFSRKKREPKPSQANPGLGPELTTAFSNSERTWSERLNLVECLSEVLGADNIRLKRHRSWLELDSGHIIIPQFLSLEPREDGSVRTTSTIEVHHPNGIPEGIFEYQHSTGENMKKSFGAGFQSWAKLDLPVLCDAVLEKPEFCSLLYMPWPSQDAPVVRHRRVIFGPVQLTARTEFLPAPEEHGPMCPCCFFTGTMEAFHPMLDDGNFHAVRFFGMRQDDEAQADCRVNGLDYDHGKYAIVKYVNTWPDIGFEMRKQYAVIQDCSPPPPDEAKGTPQ
jgi:hypothetical protein